MLTSLFLAAILIAPKLVWSPLNCPGTGVAKLVLYINTRGRVEQVISVEVEQSKSSGLSADCISNEAEKWVYTPAMEDEKPVPARVEIILTKKN